MNTQTKIQALCLKLTERLEKQELKTIATQRLKQSLQRGIRDEIHDIALVRDLCEAATYLVQEHETEAMFYRDLYARFDAVCEHTQITSNGLGIAFHKAGIK